MAMPLLDGPRLPPAAGGAPRQLVVFLHGYGADGNDLIGLGREWAKLLPHAAFVSPHAPEPCAGAPMGRQWFNLTFREAGELVTGVKHAAPALEAFLDAELKRHNLGPRALALVGFSQGTMMALGVGLKRHPRPPPSSAIPARWRRSRPCRRTRDRRRPFCWCMATATRSSRSTPCSSPASSWRRRGSPWNGTWPKVAAAFFTDYLVAMKLNDGWKIVSKSYRYDLRD